MRRLIAVSFVLAGFGIFAGPAGADDPTTTTAAPTCQTAAQLRQAIAAPDAKGVVKLSGCYTANATITIADTVGLTILGNGATITQIGDGPNTTIRPIIEADSNVGLHVRDLTLVGPWDHVLHGGVNQEGDAGVYLRGNTTADFQDVNIDSVQGDGIDVLAADDNSTNTGITWRDSTISNVGYHGVTLEAVDGITFSGDSFVHIGVDAVDSEVDIYSSGFRDGQPIFAVEDDVTFVDDTFRDFGFYWFVSDQGQTPGVQEQNVALIGNRIVSAAHGLVQIKGTKDADPQYAFTGLQIIGNYALQPARSTSGGTPGQADVGSLMTISGVTGATIQDNYIPVETYLSKPYLDVVQANHVTGLDLDSNGFPGALNILHPSSGNNEANVCANRYGAGGKTRTPDCPSGF